MNRYRGPPASNASKASANTLCQKCLKRDTFECKAAVQERPYASRPSRSQQLLNPKLAPKLNSDVPNDLLRKTGVADEVLAKSARDRKRSRSPRREPTSLRNRSRSRSRSSSSSVSTISTKGSRSRSPQRRRDTRDSDGDQFMISQHTSQVLFPISSHERKRRRRESTVSRSSSSPSSRSDDRSRRKTSSYSERNTRRRRSSMSPVQRGRRRSRPGHSMSRSPAGREGNSRSPYVHERSRNERTPPRGRPQRESSARGGPARVPRGRERSLSPFSKRLALTQAMNMDR